MDAIMPFLHKWEDDSGCATVVVGSIINRQGCWGMIFISKGWWRTQQLQEFSVDVGITHMSHTAMYHPHPYHVLAPLPSSLPSSPTYLVKVWMRSLAWAKTGMEL